MDAEKGTEVEMKELLPADKDAEKGKMEEKKEAEKAAEEKKEESKKEEKDEKKEEKEKEVKEKEEKKEEKENEDKKEQEKKEENKDKKDEESSVYCKLQTPTEDIYNPVMPSTSKSDEEAEKKKEKEITEEEPLYSKLQSPTEDVYHAATTTSKSKRKKAGKEEEKEKEEDVYCKLKDPSEDIYMSAATSSTLRQTKEAHTQVLRYKRVSAVLAILSIVLLAVVFALVMKLNDSQPNNCPCTNDQGKMPDYIPRYQCSRCEKGWLKIENACYFKSKGRLNWQDSRKECQNLGGDLAVIHNATVQKYLSMRRGLLFWIGLQYAETEQQWIWIDNKTLTVSFWANGESQKIIKDSSNCALLHGGTNSSNWYSNPCHAISQYICQKD